MEKLLIHCTVSEFLEMIKKDEPPPAKEQELVYGIIGLAKLLNVSRATAQKIKNSGKITDATYQIGRSIVFDKNRVLTLLK